MSTINYDQYNSDKLKKITIKKYNSNLNNLGLKFFNCNSVENVNTYTEMIKKSNPIDIPNKFKSYDYDNNLIGPSPPNDNINNNKDFNSILSKFSISPNTYSNFEINKYYIYKDEVNKDDNNKIS